MLNHCLGIITRKVRRPHRPKRIGHQHAIFWRGEKLLGVVFLPSLVKHQTHVIRIAADEFPPVLDIIPLAEEVCHPFQSCRDFEFVHRKGGQSLAKELLKVIFVGFANKVDITGMFVDLPSTQNVFRGLTPIRAALPGNSFVVRKHPDSAGELAEPVILREMLPGKDISVGKPRLVGGPGANLDLKRRIVAVDSQKVVHRSLGVVLHLPPLTDIDGIHQVERPKIIVDVDELRIGTTKPRDLFVEQPVHLGRFNSESRSMIPNHIPSGGQSQILIIVHGPGDHETISIARNTESVVLHAILVFDHKGVGETARGAQDGGHA